MLFSTWGHNKIIRQLYSCSIEYVEQIITCWIIKSKSFSTIIVCVLPLRIRGVKEV